MVLERPDGQIELNFWDFGGQLIYGRFSRLLFRPSDLYMIVWRPRDGDAEVRSWLRQIVDTVGDRSRIFIVATGAAETATTIEEGALRAEFGGSIEQLISVDSATGQGIGELVDSLAAIAARKPAVQIPSSWDAVRVALRSLDEIVVGWQQYLRIGATHGLTEDESENLCHYLHASGDVLYFGDDPDLRANVVVDPARFFSQLATEGQTTSTSAPDDPTAKYRRNVAAAFESGRILVSDDGAGSEPFLRERTTLVPDEATSIDRLGRVAVAEAIGYQLSELAAEHAESRFLIHLDGSWGAGKSSIMQLLEKEVRSQGWIVVKYDAWRQSKAGPPWLTLLQALRSAIVQDPSVGRTLWARERAHLIGRQRWIALTIWMALAVLGVVLFWWRVEELSLESASDSVKLIGGVLAIAATLWGATMAAGRMTALDSRRGAENFLRTRPDAMEDLADHFAWLLHQSHSNVLMLIDDIDRCERTFVVELLDTVQKLVRDKPARSRMRATDPQTCENSRFRGTLVAAVAADGRWIRQSYEVTHNELADTISEPGRPLGALFLEKLFQITVPVPQLSRELQIQFLDSLLTNEPLGGPIPQTEDALVEEIGRSTVSEALEILRSVDPLQRVRASSAVVERLYTSEGRQETAHALLPFAPLLDLNPRAIKRFSMAYTLLRSVRVAEGSDIELKPLALWTIVTTRWPLLAEYLGRNPEAVHLFRTDPDQLPSDVPSGLRSIFIDPPHDLVEVFNSSLGGPLFPDVIRRCIGPISYAE